MFNLVGDNVPRLPFEILSRKVSGDGEIWLVRCKQCGEEVTLDMADPQEGVDTEHACSRGENWLLCFGPPRTGPDLLRAIESIPAPSEELHRRCPPRPN